MRGHLVAGLTGMTAQTLAALTFGLRLRTRTGAAWYASASLLLGAVALVALGLLLVSGLRLPKAGLTQKIVQVGGDLWVLLSALYALRSARRAA